MKYKYFLVCMIFIIITFIIGDNTLFRQISYYRQIKDLKKKIRFYTKQKEENLKKLRFLVDNKNLEKLVREQYLMTKSNEELFVINK